MAEEYTYHCPVCGKVLPDEVRFAAEPCWHLLYKDQGFADLMMREYRKMRKSILDMTGRCAYCEQSVV